MQNRPVNELLNKYPPLEKMCVILASAVVTTAAWGLMWRVCIGAVLSIADIVTDILVITRFWKAEKWTYAWSMIGSLGSSILLQVVIALFQNPGRKKMKEVLFVVAGLKSPRDAYKVAKGAKKEKGNAMNPLTELVACKCIEMFAEGLPAVFIQFSAMLTSENYSIEVMLSLVVSLLTVGFTGTQISYDFDTEPLGRAQKPDFYGYIPDAGGTRLLLFSTMIVQSAVMLAIRALGIIILAFISMRYLIIFIAVDMLIYMWLKVIRDDFFYWVSR